MSGRTAVITGATGHLGRTIAETLAEIGFNLILVDLPKSDFLSLGNNLKKFPKIKIYNVLCDLEIEESRKKALKQISENHTNISCLVNNAAFVATSQLEGWLDPFEKQSIDTWRKALEVNLTSAFHFCQSLTPLLKISDGANIINITSIYGQYGPDWELYKDTKMGNPAAYASSKGGLCQLTKWLATTLSPKIRVNAISPGGIFRNQPESFIKKYEKKTPLKRMGFEEDFKGAIAFLSSDLSNYVTGHILNVDGGWGVW